MAKLIVSADGAVLQEKLLLGERTTIGRRPNNDIVLDNRAISGEHAVVIRSQNDHILEDLNSTNGTFVNGQPVKKHFLQNNDVIDLVNYRIQYVRKRGSAALEDTSTLISPTLKPGSGQSAETDMAGSASAAPAEPQRRAVLRIQNGANAGRELTLEKETTTLGRAGVQLAALIRRPDGYFIRHVEGERQTLLNDQPLGAETHALASGDMIDMSGIRIEFVLQAQ